MADKFLTLLDITKRNNADAAVGLIEEVNTVAPELMELNGRPINGTTYNAKKRSALPTKPAFRNANEGSDVVSSTYESSLSQCYFIDAPLVVDEAVVQAGQGEGNSQSQILADEATGVIAQKFVSVGDQFYRGTTADAKGFPGMLSLYDSTNCEVTAGASANTSSAYLVWNDIQGVHWIFGNNSGLNINQWTRQLVTDANGKKYFAWVNNVSGYIGLGFGHTRSIVRIKAIKNPSSGTTGFLTDALVAEALSKMPIFMRRSPNLRLLMNSTANLTLAKSRSTVVGSKTDSQILQFSSTPTESNGVPIILTDSLPQTEA